MSAVPTAKLAAMMGVNYELLVFTAAKEMDAVALFGGQRDCCNDEASCCGTGCFEHCRVSSLTGMACMVKGNLIKTFRGNEARNLPNIE